LRERHKGRVELIKRETQGLSWINKVRETQTGNNKILTIKLVNIYEYHAGITIWASFSGRTTSHLFLSLESPSGKVISIDPPPPPPPPHPTPLPPSPTMRGEGWWVVVGGGGGVDRNVFASGGLEREKQV